MQLLPTYETKMIYDSPDGSSDRRFRLLQHYFGPCFTLITVVYVSVHLKCITTYELMWTIDLATDAAEVDGGVTGSVTSTNNHHPLVFVTIGVSTEQTHGHRNIPSHTPNDVLHCVSKKRHPFYICYNLIRCHPILSILGRNMLQEIWNKHKCTPNHISFRVFVLYRVKSSNDFYGIYIRPTASNTKLHIKVKVSHQITIK